MTAVQSSYREFLELSAGVSLHATIERLDETDAADLLLARYAAFCDQGFDWERALLLAVELA
jgi:hypothetical protein